MKQLEELAFELAKLPTIGPRSARRLAYFLVNHKDALITPLTDSLAKIKQLKLCHNCYSISAHDLCDICLDDTRKKQQICVVEDALDVMNIEESRIYFGLYHVLGGVISPLNGILPEKLNLTALVNRANSNIDEIIIATNPTSEGEATALYIKNALSTAKVKITRLAIGLPSGGDIEFSDKQTLQNAFDGRHEI